MTLRLQEDWPGKSAASGGIEHPAVLHMLDVAAVAERLIAPLALPAPVKQALALLCALHDLGKISDSFRRALRDGSAQPFRHWEITEALLWHHDALLAERMSSRETRRDLLYAAAAGHRGRTSHRNQERSRSGTAPAGDRRAMLDAAGTQAVEDAAAVIGAFCALWPGTSLEPLASLEGARHLSWQLNGLLTVADWVGSNEEWFPASPPVADLAA